MRLIGRKNQRKLRQSDFRKQVYRQDRSIILVAGDGWIDLDIIRNRFPNEDDMYGYIKGLIKGLGKGVQ